MRKLISLALIALAGCTYATVSATPILLPDGGEGYKYSGRANFGYQSAEADRVMSETCAKIGGRPIIVAQDEKIIGGGLVVNTGVATAMANRQQDIIFKCI